MPTVGPLWLLWAVPHRHLDSPSSAPAEPPCCSRQAGVTVSPDWLMWPKELPSRADGLLGQRELSDTLRLGQDPCSLPVRTPQRGGSILPSRNMTRPTLDSTAHQTLRIYRGAEERSLGGPWGHVPWW